MFYNMWASLTFGFYLKNKHMGEEKIPTHEPEHDSPAGPDSPIVQSTATTEEESDELNDAQMQSGGLHQGRERGGEHHGDQREATSLLHVPSKIVQRKNVK